MTQHRQDGEHVGTEDRQDAAERHEPAAPARFHGRRHGRRLRSGRRGLLCDLLPSLRVPLPADDATVDPRSLFGRAVSAVWLEVGFGSGEHLFHLAATRPDIGFIGCEPFVNGVASLLALISQAGLDNVRVFDDDARLLLPKLTEASVERVFLLFSDPWPKKRHHRRRFLTSGTLDRLADILVDGGQLWVASDHMGSIAWTLQHTTRHRAFRWLAHRPDDWRRRPIGWVPTRYETKALAAGSTCAYLRFERRPRGGSGIKSRQTACAVARDAYSTLGESRSTRSR